MSDTPKTAKQMLDDMDEFMSEVVSDALDPSVNVNWMRCSPDLPAYVARLERQNAALVEALEGVLRVADRKTDEFDAARAAIAAAQKGEA